MRRARVGVTLLLTVLLIVGTGGTTAIATEEQAEGRFGVCVVGVDSPCNGEGWGASSGTEASTGDAVLPDGSDAPPMNQSEAVDDDESEAVDERENEVKDEPIPTEPWPMPPAGEPIPTDPWPMPPTGEPIPTEPWPMPPAAEPLPLDPDDQWVDREPLPAKPEPRQDPDDVVIYCIREPCELPATLVDPVPGPAPTVADSPSTVADSPSVDAPSAEYSPAVEQTADGDAWSLGSEAATGQEAAAAGQEAASASPARDVTVSVFERVRAALFRIFARLFAIPL
ncbi:hypothetical protein [Haloarchaeobius sp. TZWWS8]|uniref:hypothetical protein n=1 Tax=Haloarchaeobius sp. TZWWS8 TaxID=3446121 RepID=UPI003EBF81C2